MTTAPSADPREECILILAPSRRDAPAAATILQRAGLAAEICLDVTALCESLGDGAGAVLLAEEAVSAEGAAALRCCLEQLPPWSEPPILLVTARAARGSAKARLERVAGVGNVVLLERPLRAATLVSAMHSALRARRRQYQVRDYLRERERAEERLREQERELRRLNETLEQRVRERTVELEDANRRLLDEMQQRQEAERALRQAQKMEAVGQLTGGIAHDFNNLLMVVSGGLDLLEKTTDPARRQRLMSGMRQAAARGETLTRQLLAFSRRMTLSPEPVHLHALFEGMRTLVGGALRENIAVDIRLQDGLWPALADPTQLELAILNMAVNARDAMPDGGSLTIEGRNVRLDGRGESGLSGEFVRIEVRDNGTGIAPEVLDRVFDPFFTTKAVNKGTGLGLSQVYGFVKQSGGHVKIRSRLGEGASVVLHLPRAPEAAREERVAPAAPGELPRQTEARTVLLVEDNDEVASLATAMLEELGYSVTRAANAPAALAALENGHAVDLVLSDIVMPGGINGLELARELKRRDPRLPIILSTGYSDAVRDEGATEGLMLLSKPYRLDALAAALRAVIEA